jgi:transketolase C-terminal domain/subunit
VALCLLYITDTDGYIGLINNCSQVGKGLVRREGSDACLLAYGSSVNEALAAAEMLEKSGVSTTVIDARFCKPLDTVSAPPDLQL